MQMISVVCRADMLSRQWLELLSDNFSCLSNVHEELKCAPDKPLPAGNRCTARISSAGCTDC
jgi:hypothetical protein